MDKYEKLINEVFNGDAKAFEAAIEEGHEDTVSWDDFLLGETVLPELRYDAYETINWLMGYIPHATTILPYEPYLRALIQSYNQYAISEDEFFKQAEDHVKLIRNADMRINACKPYDEEILARYYENLHPYGYAAKERLARCLGYEPKIEHSLMAELWLRMFISRDTGKLPDYVTDIDCRAITVVKYREILLSHGQAEADKSPLLLNAIEAYKAGIDTMFFRERFDI